MQPRRDLLFFVILLAAACGGKDGVTPTSPASPAAGGPDLTVSGTRAGSSARIVWENFDPGHCALVEGCVAAPGWRRLLRFETFTSNVGTADFTAGRPQAHPELFQFSACHGHHHFEGYADYRLLDQGGREAGRGHKQAFCLEDTEQVASGPDVRANAFYTCGEQGISRGWGDSYSASLDCQWIDVTDVPAGTYTLQISINPGRRIAESSYANNVVGVTVTVPDDRASDPTGACATPTDGPRDCGWSVVGSFGCRAGTRMRAACGITCELGSCEGDPMLRVCAGNEPCVSREALAFNDDGCPRSFCPLTEFTCPTSSRYTLMTAPYRSTGTATCRPAAEPVG